MVRLVELVAVDLRVVLRDLRDEVMRLEVVDAEPGDLFLELLLRDRELVHLEDVDEGFSRDLLVLLADVVDDSEVVQQADGEELVRRLRETRLRDHGVQDRGLLDEEPDQVVVPEQRLREVFQVAGQELLVLGLLE